MIANEEKALRIFKADFISAQNAKKEIEAKMEEWRDRYNGKPYGNETKDGSRSKIVSRDIKKQSEWQHAELLDPFVSTPDIIQANPNSYEDAEIAPRIGLLLNTQFCLQFNRYNFMAKALKVLDVEGTCVVRLGWEYEEKEVVDLVYDEVPNPQLQQLKLIIQQALEQGDQQTAIELQQQGQQLPPTIKQPRQVKRVKPIKNHPTATVCRNDDIFIDPTCMDDFENCQFIIHRYETDLSHLKKAGIYKNLEEIKIKLDSSNIDGVYDDYKRPDRYLFNFEDKTRRKLLVYEYWGFYDINSDGINEPIVCTWVGDTIIRFEENPYPDKKLPFVVTPFTPIPFQMYGESNAELLDDIQKVKTAIYRGFVDNMALSNNAQKGIRQGVLDQANRIKFLAGKNFTFAANGNPAVDFYEGHFNELPGSIFNMLQLLSNEAESITGVKSFNQGLNSNTLGGTATGIQGVLTSASTRRLNIVRNISENLVKPILRKWLAYDAEFLDEETQIRITNDEFLWLKRDDLGANIDIVLSISTADDNQSKANSLTMMLQTTAQSLPFEITKPLLIQMAQLYRMPDLAKAIADYTPQPPQPTPEEQQMTQLQLEGMQAENALTMSKVDKNQVDNEYKQARTESEKAKAANIASKTDKQDLDYLHDYYQTKAKNEADKQARQQKFDIDKETLKLLENSNRKYL